MNNNPTDHPDTPSSPSSSLSGAEIDPTVCVRPRLQKRTLEALEQFAVEHNCSNDEAIHGLIRFHRDTAKFRYSAETGHLIAELQKLDADVLTLASLNLQVMELVRTLQQSDHLVIAQYLTAQNQNISRMIPRPY